MNLLYIQNPIVSIIKAPIKIARIINVMERGYGLESSDYVHPSTRLEQIDS